MKRWDQKKFRNNFKTRNVKVCKSKGKSNNFPQIVFDSFATFLRNSLLDCFPQFLLSYADKIFCRHMQIFSVVSSFSHTVKVGRPGIIGSNRSSLQHLAPLVARASRWELVQISATYKCNSCNSPITTQLNGATFHY